MKPRRWPVQTSGCCGKRVKARYDSRERTWRHLDLGGMLTRLRYQQRRVACPRCGVRAELVPWAEPGSNFTKPFENEVAFLAQRCDRTTVSRFLRTTWRTVGRVVQRVIERVDQTLPDRLDGLRIIGVDELSYRKGHKYITVVVDHERSRIVWAKQGKSAETLSAFFDALGPARSEKLESITVDMSAAYTSAIQERAPGAELVYDRFHVQRLVHDAVDEVRRELARELLGDERAAIKGMRWILHKNPWNLSESEEGRLAELQRKNVPLYRAYMLKETLLEILDRRQVNVARDRLEEWMAWAARSQLKPFQRVARTIKRHLDGILAYIRTRLSNGRTEGLNGKARTVTRRAFGFHSARSLIAMLFLCCGGIKLEPSHVYPFWTH